MASAALRDPSYFIFHSWGLRAGQQDLAEFLQEGALRWVSHFLSQQDPGESLKQIEKGGLCGRTPHRRKEQPQVILLDADLYPPK